MAVLFNVVMNARQEKAILALLECETIIEASAKSGVPVRTLHRWLNDSEFCKSYRSAKRLIVEKGIAELQKATSEAAKTLRRNLMCGNPSAENRAAQIIFEQSQKAIELEDLTERIEQLEANLLEASQRK